MSKEYACVDTCRSHRFSINKFGDLDKQTLLYAKSLEFSLTKKIGKVSFYTIPEVMIDLQKVLSWGEYQDFIFSLTNGLGQTMVNIAFQIFNINHYVKLDYTETDILINTITFEINHIDFIG